MDQTLFIQEITFQGYCGVTLHERQTPQPLLVDVELECAYHEAIAGDDITKTVDYAAVTESIVAFGSTQAFTLIETLTEQLSQTILENFPVSRVTLWVRKIHPPMINLQGSVGVRLTRHLDVQEQPSTALPAHLLLEQQARLPKGRLLDVAMGHGRHALFMAKKDYQVDGIDKNSEAVQMVADLARQHHLSNLTVRTLDLEPQASPPPSFGVEQYDVILVFFYLYRPLFSSLLSALKPGGQLLYETFLIDNHLIHNHPRRREFCLEHNELLQLVPGLRILHFDEGEREGSILGKSILTARLLAEKPKTPLNGQA
ncbi:MAG: dihydroneopterin aldolase [Nitrospirales bacterium]|nr:dihydroneopterin aldolase [Nitrospirales bacterium]